MAVVKKENKVERAKRERDGLACLEDLIRYARDSFRGFSILLTVHRSVHGDY